MDEGICRNRSLSVGVVGLYKWIWYYQLPQLEFLLVPLEEYRSQTGVFTEVVAVVEPSLYIETG